jgi:cytoskeletal protein RodZ
MKRLLPILFVVVVLAIILWRTFGSNQQETAPIQPPPPTAQAQVRPPVPTQAPEQKTEPAETPKQPEKFDPNYRPPAVSDPKLAPLVKRYAKNRVKTDMFNRFPEAKPVS